MAGIPGPAYHQGYINSLFHAASVAPGGRTAQLAGQHPFLPVKFRAMATPGPLPFPATNDSNGAVINSRKKESTLRCQLAIRGA